MRSTTNDIVICTYDTHYLNGCPCRPRVIDGHTHIQGPPKAVGVCLHQLALYPARARGLPRDCTAARLTLTGLLAAMTLIWTLVRCPSLKAIRYMRCGPIPSQVLLQSLQSSRALVLSS